MLNTYQRSRAGLMNSVAARLVYGVTTTIGSSTKLAWSGA